MIASSVPVKGSRAIITARFSSNLQNPLSADDQIAACRKEAERLGWEVVAAYKDEGKTGRSIIKRAGYLQAMADAEAGKGDVIMVTALDRLGRDARELHDARNRLTDADVVIYTCDRGVMSRLEFTLRAEIAQDESERIARRTSFGQRAAAYRGEIMGDLAYGYKLDDEDIVDPNTGRKRRRIEKDPVAAAVVLRVHLDYHAGLSPVDIAGALTAEGVPTPEGGSVWQPNTILGSKRSESGLLRNPIYVGRYVFGKVKSSHDAKTAKNIRVKNREEDLIVRNIPSLRIVPDELFFANAARIDDRSWEMLHRNRRPDYLLSGKLRCSCCGGPYVMVAHRLGCANHRVKACGNGRRVAREAVEEAVLEGLRERIAQPHILELFMPEYQRELEAARKEHQDRRMGAESRQADVEREIKNLLAQSRAGATGYAAQLINENLDALGHERERLARDLASTSPERLAPTSVEEVAERLRSLLRELRKALDGPERDAVRARDIVRSFVDTVTITPVDEAGSTNTKVGPMRVTIEGPIAALVDQALLDRKILHSRGAEARQCPPSPIFRIYTDVAEEKTPAREQIASDAIVVARLLDDADAPVLRSEMRAAVEEGAKASEDESGNSERRSRLALASLRRAGLVRRVPLNGLSGYVWADRDLSDADWQERHSLRDHIAPPLAIIRVQAISGYAVVIEPSDVKASG